MKLKVAIFFLSLKQKQWISVSNTAVSQSLLRLLSFFVLVCNSRMFLPFRISQAKFIIFSFQCILFWNVYFRKTKAATVLLPAGLSGCFSFKTKENNELATLSSSKSCLFY